MRVTDAAAHVDGESKRVYRIDRGRVAKGKRNHQGFIVAEGTPALSRVLEYENKDGSIRREWFPPEEASDPESLATLDGVPFTLRHPPEMVGPENVRRHQRGIVRSPRYDAETKRQRAEFVLQDADAIAAHERGDTGLSAGYYCELLKKSGTTPEGERYDFIQKKRRYNHVAGGPAADWARGGPDARLDGGQLELGEGPIARLDDADNCTFPTSNDPASTPVARKDSTMVIKHRIDGVDCEFASEAAAQVALKAVEDRDKTIAQRDSRIAALEADAVKTRTDGGAAVSAVQAKLDSATTELAETKAKLADATDPKKRAAEAAATAKLDASCKRLAPAVKLDGLDEPAAKMRAALVAAKVNLDGKDDAYVAARFDAELERLPKRDANDRKVANARAPKVDADPELEDVETPRPRKDAYQAMRERQQRDNANRPGQVRTEQEV